METRTTGINTEANSEFNALIPGKRNSFFPTAAAENTTFAYWFNSNGL